MSNHYKRNLALTGIDFSRYTLDDLRAMVRQILEDRIHGISFSPYVEGQGPGTVVGEAQIRERLAVIQPARTDSCDCRRERTSDHGRHLAR